MNLKRRNIALLLAISSISGIVAPTLLNLKELNSYAYNNEYNLSESEIEALEDIKQIVSGESHTIFLKEDGTVWGTGNNTSGQLGIGNRDNQYTPVQVPIDNVKEVVCGALHTMFLKNDGTVWGTGYNVLGQVGIGNNIQIQTSPIKVDIDNVKKVDSNLYHTLFLKEDGTVWATGSNNRGELGIGNKNYQYTPVQVNITDVKDIKSGGYYSLFIKNDGTIWGCGENIYGQLGIGNNTDQYTPIQLSITDVKEVINGLSHTIFIKNDGTVWGTGSNYSGQLGIDSTDNKYQYTPIKVPITDVKKITSKAHMTVFLKNDGTVWATGDNREGQLCTGNTNNQETIIKIPISDVNDIKSNFNNIIFIKKDKTVWGCGQNTLGQLGIGNTTNQLTPIQLNVMASDIINNEISSTDSKYSKLLQSAKDKLEKAQSSKNTIDITFAQLAIDKLNPDDKAQIQEQLNNLKEQIKAEKEILDYAKLLKDAEIKVTKAESSKKDYDITLAQNSLNKLKDIDRPQFQDRINDLVYNILLEDANLKVVTAEELRTDNTINVAQIAVDKVPHKDITTFNINLLEETDLLEKPILQSKLDSLKLSIEEERYLKLKQDSNDKVTNAEDTKTLKDIRLAQMAIDRLKELDKTELQIRLNALNLLIAQEEKEKNNIIIATTKVEQAEKMDNTKYIDEAKTLVENLKEGEDKTLLLDRISAIESSLSKTDEKTKTLIYQADVYVKQAEALKRESYIIKAQAGIDKIPNDSPERALLQDRLNKVNVKK